MHNRVYFCGGMRSGWQDKIKNTVIYTGRNEILPDTISIPLKDLIFTAEIVDFIDPRLNGTKVPPEFTTWDLFQLKDCNIVFAYLEKDNPSGFGLAAEIGYAKALGKTIIFVNEKSDDIYLRFVEELSDVVLTNFDAGIKFLFNLLYPYDKNQIILFNPDNIRITNEELFFVYAEKLEEAAQPN